MRLFIDFPMLGRTSKLCCGSPNLWPKLVALSRHKKLCRDKVFNLFHWLLSHHAVFCRDRFSELFLGFCRDRFLTMSRHSFDSIVLFLSQYECLVSQHKNLLHPALYTLLSLETVCDIIFFIATCIFLFSLSTLS